MLCKHVEPYLNALADGELSPLTAWRVRRHLRRCAACAAAYADIQRIGAAAQAWRDATAAPVPDRVRLQIRNSVAPEGAALSDLSVSRKERKMLRLVPVLAVASTALVVALVGIDHTAPVAHPVVGVAFAEVQQAVDAVRTAHVTFRMQPDSVSNADTQMMVFESWMQAEPAAFALLMPTMKMVGDSTGMTTYVPEGPPMRVSNEPITREVIRKEMLFPDVWTRQGKQQDPPRNWGPGTLTTDSAGRTLLRFVTHESGVEAVLWADPATRLPVHIEVETRTEPVPGDAEVTPVVSRFTVEFSYNEAPPAGVFAPPAVAKKPGSGKPRAK